MEMRYHLVGAIVIAGCAGWASITNLDQCVGVELYGPVVQTLPAYDNSTAERAVLGFLRGTITGDYRMHLTPMCNTLRVENVGRVDLDALSDAQTNAFYQSVHEMEVTSHVVKATSSLVTGSNATISATLRSVGGRMVKTTELRFSIAHTNGEWRIVSWDVDE